MWKKQKPPRLLLQVYADSSLITSSRNVRNADIYRDGNLQISSGPVKLVKHITCSAAFFRRQHQAHLRSARKKKKWSHWNWNHQWVWTQSFSELFPVWLSHAPVIACRGASVNSVWTQMRKEIIAQRRRQTSEEAVLETAAIAESAFETSYNDTSNNCNRLRCRMQHHMLSTFTLPGWSWVAHSLMFDC